MSQSENIKHRIKVVQHLREHSKLFPEVYTCSFYDGNLCRWLYASTYVRVRNSEGVWHRCLCAEATIMPAVIMPELQVKTFNRLLVSAYLTHRLGAALPSMLDVLGEKLFEVDKDQRSEEERLVEDSPHLGNNFSPNHNSMKDDDKKEATGEQRKLTLGEYRVGVNFNPGGHELVNRLKAAAAKLIDLVTEKLPDDNALETAVNEYDNLLLEGAKATHNPEAGRCYVIAQAYALSAFDAYGNANYTAAQDDYETSAMWSVKGSTKPDREVTPA